ncbi:MAG: hypothetical protein L3J39_18695 [Verrucomicrobiales bacterium]|nr:hypothetical protein [Verrucomicrobiales bacterium]
MNMKSRRVWLVVAFAMLLGVGGVWAFMHEGKDAAIGAALPKLDLPKNPYVLREAWWQGELKGGETKLIKHQLFKRNDYWFWMGASNPDAKVSIHIYDEGGNLVDEESFEKNDVAGARVVPKNSGIYYIRIKVLEGTAGPSEWAVIYAFR